MNTMAQAWLANNGDKFNAEDQLLIRKKLEAMTDDQATILATLSLQNPMTVLLVAIFFGPLGVHRFMIGDTGMGLLELFTLGGCGVLSLIDLFTISGKVKKANFTKVLPYL